MQYRCDILACSGMHYVTRSLSNIYFFSCFVITYVIRNENFCIFLLITIQALLQVRKLCSMTIYLLLISRGILMSWLWQNCYIFNLWLIYCERYNIFLRPLPALMDPTAITTCKRGLLASNINIGIVRVKGTHISSFIRLYSNWSQKQVKT